MKGPSPAPGGRLAATLRDRAETSARDDTEPAEDERRPRRGRDFYRQIGRRGGEKRRSQLGAEGYRALGRTGGDARKQILGVQGYAQLGRKGGEARTQLLGSNGDAALGRTGGQRVAELIRRGRATLNGERDEERER